LFTIILDPDFIKKERGHAMKKLLWLVFGLLSFLSFLPIDEVYAVSAPDFSTINLQDRFSPVGSSSGTVLGTSANNYIDIVGDDLNRPGAVWFNEPLNLNEDFKLEMYFALGLAVGLTPSEGWAFVMQSQGTGAIAAEGGQSLGVWANRSPSGSPNAGAIQDGVAIEFDTFHNADFVDLTPNKFDTDVSLLFEGGSHVAWGYPGRESTYRNVNFGMVLPNYQKVMNHQGVRTDRDLNYLFGLNTWRPFTVSYDASTGKLTYSSYWINGEVVVDLFPDRVEGQDLSPENSAFDDPSNVYFGFTGSNSLVSQQRSVALRRLEIGDTVITPDGYDSDSTVTLSGSMEVDDEKILDVNTGATETAPVEELSFDDFTAETNENKKTFTYNIVAKYENSETEFLPEGAQITMRVPDILEPKDDPDGPITVNINGLEVEFEPVTSFSGDGGEFMRVEGEDQYIFSLPELSDGDTVSISLTTVVKSDPDLIIDKKIELYEVFSASFEKEGEIFVETGERDETGEVFKRPHYILEAIYEPTLSGEVYDSSDNAINQMRHIFPEQGFSIDLGADDLNSTKATVYASEWLRGGESPPVFNSNDPSNHENLGTFERTLLTEDFGNKNVDFRGGDIPGLGIFYKVFYLVDIEGNVSSPQYLAVEILERGMAELTGVPNFLFESTNLSTIRNSIESYGFVDINLESGVVAPDQSLGETQGNNALHLAVNNINKQPANWRLNAFLDDFNIVRTQSTGTISAMDIELHLTVADDERIISHSTNLIHEAYNDVDGFYQTIEEAKLRIRGNAIRAGVYQGAINWEFIDSIQ
jgi:hypothetical protein